MDKFTNNYGKMIFNINYVTWLISCLVLGANIRNQQNVHGVTLIKGQKIEQGQSYKYIATIINEKLNFDENCKLVYKGTKVYLFLIMVPILYEVNFSFFLQDAEQSVIKNSFVPAAVTKLNKNCFLI